MYVHMYVCMYVCMWNDVYPHHVVTVGFTTFWPHQSLFYYNDNWHPIQEEWVECFKNTALTLGERTNNRLESINAKVKSVCARYSNCILDYSTFHSNALVQGKHIVKPVLLQ